MKKNTQKGFTLVELLVVIAILAILASVAVVGYTSFIKKADDQAAATELDQVKGIIDNAFLVETSVVVTLPAATEGADPVTYILTKGTTGVVAAPAGDTDVSEITDISNDIGAELLAKLSYADGVLKYTYKTNTPVALTVVAPATGN